MSQDYEIKYESIVRQLRKEILEGYEREKQAQQTRWELLMENKRLYDELQEIKSCLTDEFKMKHNIGI